MSLVMSSVVIVGASRGLGFALAKLWSENPANIVVALVRNKTAAISKFQQNIGNKENLFVLAADLENFDSLKVCLDVQHLPLILSSSSCLTVQAALEETSSLLNNKLDYLIVNAAVSDSIVDNIGNA
ncbi:hypothetical protein ACHAQJ_004508 [Trichoderma viride]